MGFNIVLGSRRRRRSPSGPGFQGRSHPGRIILDFHRTAPSILTCDQYQTYLLHDIYQARIKVQRPSERGEGPAHDVEITAPFLKAKPTTTSRVEIPHLQASDHPCFGKVDQQTHTYDASFPGASGIRSDHEVRTALSIGQETYSLQGRPCHEIMGRN